MRSHLLSMLAVVGLTGACGSDDTGTDADAVTYYRDVKPIVDAKCVGCHSPEGIAPFSLQTFDDVQSHGALLVAAVESGIMPPWPPNDECNDYLGDRSLSAEHKATLRAWLDGGRAEGDAADEAAPLEIERVQLSRVDRELRLPEPYMPQTTADTPDDYRCFVMPWTDDTTRYITGFRATPGNAKVVHHVVAFLARPDQVARFQQKDADEAGEGYTCFGGPGGPDGGRNDVWLGSWAPGTLGSDFPAGTGIRVEPGSAVIVQVHYNVLEASPQPDQSSIQLRLDDAVTKEARVQPWANPSWIGSDAMMIPAGQADVTHAFEFDASLAPEAAGGPGGPFTIYSAGLHMHQLGTRTTASVVHADGSRTCLLQIDDWNFHWQGGYGLREPVAFQTGDKLRVECHWDNSPENQGIVNGEQRLPADVTWGESTSDEMCLGLFYITRD
jgi:hypothetical protein